MFKLSFTLFFCLISLTIFGQNKPFWIILRPDTFLLNRMDTVFNYKTAQSDINFNNGILQLKYFDDFGIDSYGAKVDGFRKDSLKGYPIAKIISHGRMTRIAKANNVIITEGNIVNGKKIGVWHDRTEDFDNLSVYDSLSREMPLRKFYIDTICQRIHLYKIDTIAFVYDEIKEIKLIVNPIVFFKSENAEVSDTLRFCVLNYYMDSIGYKSYKAINEDFVRFIWFRPYHPITLNISKNDSTIKFNLRVTDAEYDFDFGNVVQSDSIIQNDTKEFEKISCELDSIDFWNQISMDMCHGDYLFVEARINGKYNCKRINCLEYRLEENKSIMKLFKKHAKLAGVKHDYRIKY
jgi:hypothetical protein